MAGLKTEFLNGTQLFYPLETLPALFDVVGAISRKGFYEKLAEIDGPGGDGLSLEQITEIVRIGLIWVNPAATTETATDLVNKYYDKHGYEALEAVIVDAFANSGLSDKSMIEKRKALLLEIKELDLKSLEYELARKKAILEGKRVDLIKPPQIPEGLDMGGTKPKPLIKPQTRKRKTT